MTETTKDPKASGAEASSSGETTDAAATETKRVVRVAVGSKNPVKVKAARLALEKALASSPSTEEVDLEVQGFDVPSEVPDQPFGDVRRSLEVLSLMSIMYNVHDLESVLTETFHLFCMHRRKLNLGRKIEQKGLTKSTRRQTASIRISLLDWREAWSGRPLYRTRMARIPYGAWLGWRYMASVIHFWQNAWHRQSQNSMLQIRNRFVV
jgi:hypothetical protein